MPDVEMIRITNGAWNGDAAERDRFYRLMGPYLCNRDVQKDMDAPVWDDDDRTWHIALIGGEVAGFCAAADKTQFVQFASAYVRPEFRDQGVYEAMTEHRLSCCRHRPCKVTCKKDLQGFYEAQGFGSGKEHGKFITMIRPAEEGYEPPAGDPPPEPEDSGGTGAGEPPVEDTGPRGRTQDAPTAPPAANGQVDLFTAAVADDLPERAAALFAELDRLAEGEQIRLINELRLALAEYSPMKDEPVDCVIWVPAADIQGNAYNPNVVAPPEMKLLTKSIRDNGYTQPIVAWREDGADHWEVVDGFHRHKVGTDNKAIRKRVRGHLPITVVRPERTKIADRMAATIQHNQARGLHTVEGDAQMVLYLSRIGKTDEEIGEMFGMSPGQVNRLKDITGMADQMADEEFSEAWEPSYTPEPDIESS